MEIYAHEEGGEEELLRCEGCGAADLAPREEAGATGSPAWSLMSRLAVVCRACGAENRFAWEGRVRFRFVREGARA